MEIKEAQRLVDQWIQEKGVRYFDPLTNMAMLTEEVGEVARIMARRYGEQSEKDSDKEKNLGDELADVFFVLVCIANQTNVDLEKAFQENLVKRRKGMQPGISTILNCGTIPKRVSCADAHRGRFDLFAQTNYGCTLG